MTNFFTQLNDMLSDNSNVQLSTTKKQNDLVITFRPSISSNQSINESIHPITIQGNPNELDEEFFNAIIKVKPHIDKYELDFDYLDNVLKAKQTSKKESAFPATKKSIPQDITSETKKSYSGSESDEEDEEKLIERRHNTPNQQKLF